MKKVLITGGGGMVGSAMESPLKLTRDYCDLLTFKKTNIL